MSLDVIMRDYLIRYQQRAIKTTGHRPMAVIHQPMDEPLFLSGCPQKGYSYWQPIPWKAGKAPIGSLANQYHPSIVSYVSLCQFLEIRFQLPISHSHPSLHFLQGRIFETYRNTESMPPSLAFEEAVMFAHFEKDQPLHYAFAQTCDGKAPLLLLLDASTAKAYIVSMQGDATPLHVSLSQLLPKLQFVFEGW